jgi:peptide/nickel transport system substrate-binding protein
VRHVDKEMVELEANPDYFGGVPAIEKVIFKFGGNALADLRAGTIQAVGSAPAVGREQVAMRKDPDFRTFFDELLPMSIAVYWNHRNPLFQRVSVRRALTMAINRPELVTVLNVPEQTRIVDVVVPFFPGGIDPGEALPYDPETAHRLLAEAGWMDEDGDGILERQGQKFQFTAVVGGIVGGWNTEQAAVYVQAKLKEVGVQMDIRPLGGARMVRNAIESGEADAAVHRLHFDNLTWAVTEEAYVGFEDQEIRGHFLAADAAWDPEMRRRHFMAGLELVRERLPVTILFPMVEASIAHRRVKGLQSPDRVDPTAWAHELWIERDQGGPGGSGG